MESNKVNNSSKQPISITATRREAYRLEDITDKQTKAVAEKVLAVLTWRNYKARAVNNHELITEIEVIEQTILKELVENEASRIRK